MKNDTLEIRFQDFKTFKKATKDALSKRKKTIQPKNHIYFESLAVFRHFMTIQKIEILTVIVNCHPGSIYELANMVDRDFAAVLRDCNMLEGTGFIKLKPAKDNKNTKIPELSFDYSSILVKLPQSEYSIEFDTAA